MDVVGSHRVLVDGATGDPMRKMVDARLSLLLDQPFFGELATQLDIQIDEDGKYTKTAGVTENGRLYIHPPFLEKISDAESIGLVAHEVLHPALGIFRRQANRDHNLSNRAHDYVINLMINDMQGIELPKDGLLDERFRGLTYEEVYELLLEERERKRRGDPDPQGGGEGPDGGPSTDPSSPGKYSEADQQQAAKDALDEDFEGDLVDDGSTVDPAAQREAERRWKEIMATAKVNSERKGDWGKLPGGLRQMVDEILDPKLDWATILAQFIGTHGPRAEPTYRRPSRRSVPTGMILPGLEGSLQDVAIIIDTSGSMIGGPLEEVMGEIHAVVDDLGLASRVISIDAKVHEVIEDPQSIAEVIEKLAGGGGSDMTPAFVFLEQMGYQGPVVVATDGYVTTPEFEPFGMPTLWLISSNGAIPATWGIPLRIPSIKRK